jgi:hypothetical protein
MAFFKKYEKYLRDFIINFSLTIISITFTFTFVELFFYHKSKTSTASPSITNPYFQDATDLPSNIIDEAKNKFDSKNYSLALFEKQNSLKNLSKIEQTPRLYPTNLIKFHHTDRELQQAVSIREKRFSNDEVFYDVTYNLNDRHVRISNNKPTIKKFKNFLSLGCSYTFGVGVNDSETISGHLAKKINNYNFYNLGVPGGGLTEILDDIYFKDRLTNLNKNGGVVVYYFWQDHFRRYLKNIDTPLKERVFYEIENDALTRSQPYLENTAWQNNLINFIEKSYFLRYINFGQNNFSIENQNKFINYLSFVKNFYKNNYNLDFYVFILDPVDTPSKYFLEKLSSRGIKYIRYKRLIDDFDFHEITIGGDGHYNSKGLFLYSELTRFSIQKDHPDF